MSSSEIVYNEELGYNVSYESLDQYSPEVERKINKFHSALMEDRFFNIKDLEKCCHSYPNTPDLKNILAIAYHQKEQKAKFKETVDWMIKDHPSYFYGKVNLVQYYFWEKDFEKIHEVLPHTLKSMYPDRDVFHFGEVRSFYAVWGEYYIQKGKIRKANDCLDILDDVDTEMNLSIGLRARLIEKNRDLLEAESNSIRSVEATRYEKEIQTSETPIFTHAEIWHLYQYEEDIPIDIIEIILLLPQESLIRDLHIVLEDGIRRYEYYAFSEELKEENIYSYLFVEHALYFLAELRSKESLPHILRLLRQGEELLDFYFSFNLDQAVNDVLFILENQDIEFYKKFLLEPNHGFYVRSMMSAIVSEIFYRDPGRREEIVEWYESIYQFFLSNPEDESQISSHLIGLMVAQNCDMNLVELESTIKSLWDNSWIPPSIMGDWEDIQEILREENKSYRQRIKGYDIYKRYEFIIEQGEKIENMNFPSMLPPEEEFDFEEDDYMGFDSFYDPEPFPQIETFVRETPKVGRNAPCPCGSGKKYKKCCLNKD
ncbi:MAG: DUF1186 domain-containing protein [Bacteroidota bacterium]